MNMFSGLHGFDTGIASELGLSAAILYNLISRSNDAFISSKSYEDIHDFCPYLSLKEIKTGVKKLEQAGLIKKGIVFEKV